MMKRTSSHIKLLLSVIFTLVSLINYAQEERKVERLWVNANCSFARYGEVGVNLQIFNQFLVGGYFQSFNRKVGPGVPQNPYALLWTEHYYKKDVVNSGTLMIGFASPTPHPVMLSFLAGPSLNKSITHSDFKVTYGGGDYHHYVSSVSATVTERWKIGLNYKATLSFIIGNYACLNFGLAGNHNGVDNYYRFIFGIGLGEFGREKPPK